MSGAAQLAQSLVAGDRRALSKAITLVESSLEADRQTARELLSHLTEPKATFRIGVTGVPGAGKSTLIDGLGLAAVAAGKRVAVLAVDPSSRQSGGSVLGDKTRMTQLSSVPSAFVRPSPTRGVLGGTAARTREVILLCEAAGYDVIFVETVGVGQSEERVASMVDCVLLVLLAGAGDELSSMKRGVLEAADLIAFNKADAGPAQAVQNEAASLRASLSISRPGDMPPVLAASALEGAGVGELWAALLQQHAEAEQHGALARRRLAQRRSWFESALEEALLAAFANSPDLALAKAAAEYAVDAGIVSPVEAAQRLADQAIPGQRS